MNLIMLGPPGGGKGTYSSRISENYGIPHIAMGDILRREVNEGSDLGKKVEEYMEKGELAPDELVNEVAKKRLSEPDCEAGFILDGYPRTLTQAKALDKVTDTDLVINLEISEEVIIERLANRRICKECGAIYNLKSMPPEEEGVCDECGGELYQREDDKPKVIRKRLGEYRKQSEPLIDYYREKNLVEDIVAQEERPIEEMMEEIYAAIKKAKPNKGS
ncbi:adenylate kinase [candidate division MSBL1 archaeon SCGC-AAA382F02]|uniref:Adenylate kinase n=1 Tax=candidate division MSBL1 archaeon SCGC-AAA382F02 TaxID=1698282 RepID=A0A133VJ32_9EURY|nr:adenylate kinase [candidate division MSBL1 archaeon SCGC-AAA382F02]